MLPKPLAAKIIAFDSNGFDLNRVVRLLELVQSASSNLEPVAIFVDPF